LASAVQGEPEVELVWSPAALEAERVCYQGVQVESQVGRVGPVALEDGCSVRRDDFPVDQGESVAGRAVLAESADGCLARQGDFPAGRGDLFRLDERLVAPDDFQE
jgi:hypothetical protein